MHLGLENIHRAQWEEADPSAADVSTAECITTLFCWTIVGFGGGGRDISASGPPTDLLSPRWFKTQNQLLSVCCILKDKEFTHINCKSEIYYIIVILYTWQAFMTKGKFPYISEPRARKHHQLILCALHAEDILAVWLDLANCGYNKHTWINVWLKWSNLNTHRWNDINLWVIYWQLTETLRLDTSSRSTLVPMCQGLSVAHVCKRVHVLGADRSRHAGRLALTFAAFSRGLLWNRREFVALPSWMSFREICPIKMSPQSSFGKPPTCSCDKCRSHTEQMCHKKHKHESDHNGKKIIICIMMDIIEIKA